MESAFHIVRRDLWGWRDVPLLEHPTCSLKWYSLEEPSFGLVKEFKKKKRKQSYMNTP